MIFKSNNNKLVEHHK